MMVNLYMTPSRQAPCVPTNAQETGHYRKMGSGHWLRRLKTQPEGSNVMGGATTRLLPSRRKMEFRLTGLER